MKDNRLKNEFCPESLQKIKRSRSLDVRNEDEVLSIHQLGTVSPLHHYPSPARLLCAAAAASVRQHQPKSSSSVKRNDSASPETDADDIREILQSFSSMKF